MEGCDGDGGSDGGDTETMMDVSLLGTKVAVCSLAAARSSLEAFFSLYRAFRRPNVLFHLSLVAMNTDTSF